MNEKIIINVGASFRSIVECYINFPEGKKYWDLDFGLYHNDIKKLESVLNNSKLRDVHREILRDLLYVEPELKFKVGDFGFGTIQRECILGEYTKWEEMRYGFLHEIKIDDDKENEKINIKYVLNTGGDFYSKNDTNLRLEECLTFSKLTEIPKYKGLRS